MQQLQQVEVRNGSNQFESGRVPLYNATSHGMGRRTDVATHKGRLQIKLACWLTYGNILRKILRAPLPQSSALHSALTIQPPLLWKALVATFGQLESHRLPAHFAAKLFNIALHTGPQAASGLLVAVTLLFPSCPGMYWWQTQCKKAKKIAASTTWDHILTLRPSRNLDFIFAKITQFWISKELSQPQPPCQHVASCHGPRGNASGQPACSLKAFIKCSFRDFAGLLSMNIMLGWKKEKTVNEIVMQIKFSPQATWKICTPQRKNFASHSKEAPVAKISSCWK